jgi:thiamine-phosphate pyrophosphorylase
VRSSYSRREAASRRFADTGRMEPGRRRQALQRARLYFVSDASGGPGHVAAVIAAALEGGADLVQLRERALGGDDLAAAGAAFHEAANAAGALFFINDDPRLARACGADGVHVGQDDMGVAEARELAGKDILVGLSTHSPAQLEAACSAPGDARPDYLSVGPVWATPTKPGRPAAGLDYVRHAAAAATLPWFAIGGIDAANVGQVVAAGARRIVVVRAIRDAADPAGAARELRDAVVKSS